MSTCANHAAAPATVTCAGCGEPYCADCTVEFQGRTYCGACKLVAVRRAASVKADFKLASEAYLLAILGIVCFGIILHPFALVRSLQALREIKKRPGLPGRRKAIAALVISSIMIALYVLYFVLLFVGVMSA